MNKEISQNKHKFYKNNTSQKINHPTNPNAHINSFNGSQNSKMQTIESNSRINLIKSRKSPQVKDKSYRSPKHDESYDQHDNIKMINESMIQLQDPTFIAHQIDDFENRLQALQAKLTEGVKGFCQITRQKSLKLSNTQAYRKYKKQISKIHQKQQKSRDTLKLNNKGQNKDQKEQKIKQKQEAKTKQNKQNAKYLDNRDKSSSSSSLQYSSDSRQRNVKKISKNQSGLSMENNSNVTDQIMISEQNNVINNESTMSQQLNPVGIQAKGDKQQKMNKKATTIQQNQST